jgi:hypothetical protein
MRGCWKGAAVATPAEAPAFRPPNEAQPTDESVPPGWIAVRDVVEGARHTG